MEDLEVLLFQNGDFVALLSGLRGRVEGERLEAAGGPREPSPSSSGSLNHSLGLVNILRSIQTSIELLIQAEKSIADLLTLAIRNGTPLILAKPINDEV